MFSSDRLYLDSFPWETHISSHLLLNRVAIGLVARGAEIRLLNPFVYIKCVDKAPLSRDSPVMGSTYPPTLRLLLLNLCSGNILYVFIMYRGKKCYISFADDIWKKRMEDFMANYFIPTWVSIFRVIQCLYIIQKVTNVIHKDVSSKLIYVYIYGLIFVIDRRVLIFIVVERKGPGAGG